MRTTLKFHSLTIALLFTLSSAASSQAIKAHDPGRRATDNSVGDHIDGLLPDQINLFNEGLRRFTKVDTIADDGLGPRMNLNSCAACHSQPAIGGSSPSSNPQYQFVQSADHGNNKLPYFITAEGPTREARFKKTVQGSTDGGVHNLFTISGMSGANTCELLQPDFDKNKSNTIFRIPSPVFGAGLIEQVRDRDILNNIHGHSSDRQHMKIVGRLNIVVPGNTRTQQNRINGEVNNNGNDGTIARFGWKAQNKSLLVFAGEAYNVEMGISNELFQTEREEDCPNLVVKMPNDITNPPDPANPLAVLSDIEVFASFMRFLAPPKPSETSPGGAPSILKGKALFTQIGCALCHSPVLNTDPNSVIPALAGKPVNLFSDLAIHRMGNNLEDGISQGEADGFEFRTAPLWGLGQRLFFLHDGRTNDLVVAIQQHKGKKSEANGVIKKYERTSETDKQDLLNFLRSL